MLPIFMFLHELGVNLRQLERILRSVMGYKQFELDAVANRLSYELPYTADYLHCQKTGVKSQVIMCS